MQGDYYYVYVDTVHSLRDGYRQQAIGMDFEHDAGEGGRWGGLGGQRWRMTDEAQADACGRHGNGGPYMRGEEGGGRGTIEHGANTRQNKTKNAIETVREETSWTTREKHR